MNGYSKKQKIKILNRFRQILMRKMLKDIYSMGNLKDKYDPVPILMMSIEMVHCYVSIDNCIILNNPKIDHQTKRDIYYDRRPFYVGRNIPQEGDPRYDINEGIGIRFVLRSKIGLLCSKKQFEMVIQGLKRNFVFIPIPDFRNGIKMDNRIKTEYSKIKTLDDEFVMLMFAVNNKDETVTQESKWTLEFTEAFKHAMVVNMRGTETNTKHHGTMGDYYGIGVINKYALEDGISIGKFAGNNRNNTHVRSAIDTIADDIAYTMSRLQRSFPLALYCGFILVNSLLQVSREFPSECSRFIDLIEDARENINKISVSNWVCENAQTKEFHQEYDSSYTMISVPFWDVNTFEASKTIKGEANFLFKWTSNDLSEDDQKYLPLQMKDGITILFSGFGCFHRQHIAKTGVFWNIASYQNGSFYSKVRSSIIRLTGNSKLI